MVGARRIELRASTVSRWRSTTELCALRRAASKRKNRAAQAFWRTGFLPLGRGLRGDHAVNLADEVFEMEGL